MNQIFVGDCRETMRRLIAQGVKVQMCVTSPPYWGLRDYGTAKWEGGDPACAHGVKRWEGPKQTQGAQSGHASKADQLSRMECICGARRVDQQLGLEPTIPEFIGNMVEVFDLVRELLSDDGTLWLNIGDSYVGSWGAQGRPQGDGQMAGRSVTSARQIEAHPKFDGLTGNRGKEMGLKPKDLAGVPWRLAFALQEQGWYLRQDIIWHKPNPMPESVRDRCTKSHEYIFLLAKSETYLYDNEAIAEPVSAGTVARYFDQIDQIAGQHGSDRVPGKTNGPMKAVVKKSGNKERKPASARGVPVDTDGSTSGAVAGSVPWEGTTRNKRSVWTVTTKPYTGAHFATYPPELIEPCILAGSKPGDIVFDPFMGSGTTAQVALQLGRQYLGCELNPEYAKLAEKRTKVTPGFQFEAA